MPSRVMRKSNEKSSNLYEINCYCNILRENLRTRYGGEKSVEIVNDRIIV